MTVIYDTGPLIAIDRNDRAMWAYHRRVLEQGRRPITTAPVVAQVSRSSHQVQLHRLLAGCQVVGFTADDSRSVGALLADANTSDVVDAHLVRVAERNEALIVTSDGDDITHLAAQLNSPVRHRQL